MSPKPPEINALLAAMRDAAPCAPPPPWMTLTEMMEALKLTKAQMRHRVTILTKQGRLERLQAPGRETGKTMIYYKLKAKK